MKKLYLLIFFLFSISSLEAFTKPSFEGEVVYSCKASGSNTEGVKLFEGFVSPKVTLNWRGSYFRLQEEGGLNQADIIADFSEKKYFLLKGSKLVKAGCNNLDESPSEVKAILPYHFKTELKPLQSTDMVSGIKCKNYEILKSAFLKEGATGKLCISEDIQLPLSRYDFHAESTRTIVPLPLNFILDKGSVMKSEIIEDNVKVVCEITSINRKPKDISFFQPPKK
jgi:hypothetical protein